MLSGGEEEAEESKIDPNNATAAANQDNTTQAGSQICKLLKQTSLIFI